MPNSNSEGLEEGVVRAQLNRILASEEFANASRMSRFLRFAVETKLRGEADQIKEYLIGCEVFDRGDDYDPRVDPIVRVEARRLRAKIEEYYAGTGLKDSVRIRLPKGSYAPSFEARENGPVAANRVRFRVAAAAVLLAVLGGFFYLSPEPSADTIAVAPAHWLGWNLAEPNAFAEALVETLTVELARRRNLPVISWPSMLAYRDAGKPLGEVAAELNAAGVLIVSVVRFGDEVRITLHLVETATDRKAWAADYSRPVGNELQTQRELARVIGEELEVYWRGRE